MRPPFPNEIPEQASLDRLYDTLAGDLIVRLPDSWREGTESDLLKDILDRIILGSKPFNAFSHGTFFRYEGGTTVQIVALSEKARRALRVQTEAGLVPQSLDDSQSGPEGAEGILDWMFTRDKPLIISLTPKATIAYEYVPSLERYRKIKGKVDFSANIRMQLLANRDSATFAAYGDPHAAVTSDFSLWAPFKFRVWTGEKDEAPQPPNAKRQVTVFRFLSLTFSSNPIIDQASDTLVLRAPEEIKRILELLNTTSHFFAQQEYIVKQAAELRELVRNEAVTRGLIMGAALYIGIRHALTFQANLVESQLIRIRDKYAAESRYTRWFRHLLRKFHRPREASVDDLLGSTLGSARKLAEFTRGLRSFSLNISDLEPDTTTLGELRKLVDDTLFLLQLGPEPERDVVAQVSIAPDLPPTLILPVGAIQLLLFALLENAKNAMQDGTIHVRISTSGENLLLEVQDEGKGLPKSAREKLFEPFFTTKDRSVHTGLGLYMVKRVLERLGGKIEYESEENRGTTFRIMIPQ